MHSDGSSEAKSNLENCKNCSPKCAYDCVQLQYTIQHRTVLIISPPMLCFIIKLHKHSIIFSVSLGVLFPSVLFALCIVVYVYVLYWLFGLMTAKLNKYYYYYSYLQTIIIAPMLSLEGNGGQ